MYRCKVSTVNNRNTNKYNEYWNTNKILTEIVEITIYDNKNTQKWNIDWSEEREETKLRNALSL